MKKNTFLVLVPHRDIRLKLKKYSDNLIKQGLLNVYNFPLIAPLAHLSDDLTADELKQSSQLLRSAISVMEDDKINITETANIPFPVSLKEKSTVLYGYRIDLILKTEDLTCFSDKIISLFSPLVIGAFLKHEPNLKGESSPLDENFLLQDKLSTFFREEAQLFFRAAAIANMHWNPFLLNGELCYKWKIGKLSWLPRKNLNKPGT